MSNGRIQVLNWNIAGAKYLELKGKDSPRYDRSVQMSREEYREQLNLVFQDLIRRDSPDVITLQEVVRYSDDGTPEHTADVIDVPDGYIYHPEWLIDTQHHSATGKWDNVRDQGEWGDNAFFAQGNAILIKKSIGCYRPFDLPAIRPNGEDINASQRISETSSSFPVQQSLSVEAVKLESGLYLGDRNTEPRAAIVAHLVLNELRSGPRKREIRETLDKPLDIFVINLHLTTLLMEREGIPGIDEEASQTRLRQIDIVLNGIVSRYNTWGKEGYKWKKEGKKAIEGRLVRPRNTDRHKPIWVIAGDFNFTPESMEYLTMVRRGFIDMIANHKVGTKTSGFGESPTLTVDYIFAGPRFEAIDPKLAAESADANHVEVTNDTRISDHFPVIVSVPIELPTVSASERTELKG